MLARMLGIYVETAIRAELDEVWQKTQNPELHQRWDLRFSLIRYLPRQEGEPQRFLYETRIGFGLAIAGEGESVGERKSDEERTSALRFWSQDWRSLIAEGSGYWKYKRGQGGVQFLTWYDYRVRYGKAGAAFDRLFFRPLIGWATAWSFDRLRLWIEDEAPPETTLRWSAMYAIARACVIAIWLWHGLVPKLLYADGEELGLLAAGGLPASWLPAIGWIEVVFGVLGVASWRWRGYFAVTAALMVMAVCGVAATAPAYLHHAFNPVTLNLAVIGLCAMGWIAMPSAAFAGRCRRRGMKEER